MGTRLEEVLAEEWSSFPGLADIVRGERPFGEHVAGFKPMARDEGSIHCTRAAVAVLGKQALAMLLKHEFCSDNGERSICPECGGWSYPMGHDANCEWGRIVAAAKALG